MSDKQNEKQTIMNTVTLIRDTNFSFLKTTTNEEGASFTRKLEKGSVDYSNACGAFHRNSVELTVGNSVVI